MSDNRARIDTMDYVLGLRGWGLILYGALPSNLSLLGVLDVKLGKTEALLPLLLPASILPVLITFLLVRSRQRDWYLTTDYLNTRSAVVTFLIVVCAALISGLSGLIHGRYLLSFSSFPTPGHVAAMSESFLIAVATLVLTSTLFVTAVTKDMNLPGLPSPELVKLMMEIRGYLKKILAAPIWENNVSPDDDLIGQAQKLKDSLKELVKYPGNTLAKRSLALVESDTNLFVAAIEEIKNGTNKASKELIWEKYFALPELLSQQTKLYREAVQSSYSAIVRMKNLRLGR
jgi:hypothetical protein